jgi:hypothetical protein
MTWQAITFIALWAISATVHLLKHGEPSGKYNFGIWIISFGIEFGLLYSAGLFDKVN